MEAEVIFLNDDRLVLSSGCFESLKITRSILQFLLKLMQVENFTPLLNKNSKIKSIKKYLIINDFKINPKIHSLI